MLYRSAVLLVFASAVAVAAAPQPSPQPTEGLLGLEPGFLIPMVGAPIPEGFPDRRNCGSLPDTGMSGFFDPMNTERMLQGDGNILNGTQGRELVAKGCKTMLPNGSRKFTRKPGENGISAAKCIRSDPGDSKLGAGLKHETSGLKYSVYIAHPMRANVTAEASREKCEEQLKQVLTECAHRASGGWVLEKRDNKEWLYYGLRVTECDGELTIAN